jgi:enoyl-CoA hydratase/carnithine racemase
VSSDQPEQISVEAADGILTITLNRPERLNAWTAQMGAEMRAATAPTPTTTCAR